MLTMSVIVILLKSLFSININNASFKAVLDLLIRRSTVINKTPPDCLLFSIFIQTFQAMFIIEQSMDNLYIDMFIIEQYNENV